MTRLGRGKLDLSAKPGVSFALGSTLGSAAAHQRGMVLVALLSIAIDAGLAGDLHA